MVVVNVNDDNFYLDGYLKSNLDLLSQSLKKDYDFFIVIDGRERFGKSTLASQIAYYLDPTYNLDRCVFTADQFAEAVEKAKKFQAIVFDEAHGYLGSRSSMSSFNKKLVKIMTEMGSKNLIVILCLPNFFELDKYPAIWRSSCLLHVHQRGRFCFYNYKKKQDLYLKGKRFYAYNVSANFHGCFIKFFPLDKEEYENKKLVSVAEHVKTNSKELKYSRQINNLLEYIKKNMDVSQEELAKVMGIDQSTVSRRISLGNSAI